MNVHRALGSGSAFRAAGACSRCDGISAVSALTLRRRLGLIVPAANSTCELDFALLAPPGVTTHADRSWSGVHLEENDETVERMNADVEQAARHLAAARVEASGRQEASPDALSIKAGNDDDGDRERSGRGVWRSDSA